MMMMMFTVLWVVLTLVRGAMRLDRRLSARYSMVP